MEVFDKIYEKNSWGSKESRSGPGSTLRETKRIREALPRIFKDYEISSVLDVPCGDFNWMREVDLTGINYIGGDIVSDVVEKNRAYEKENISFRRIDLCESELPSSDLLIIRDCLVHLSLKDIERALNNIRKSQYRYILTTTFPLTTDNQDIPTGSWRAVNCQLLPFNFGIPLEIINEGKRGKNSDKSMGLWKL